MATRFRQPWWASSNGAHGHHWIRDEKRLAIYQRDGFCCVWCGERGGDHFSPGLSLDHLLGRDSGGTNAADNLVTACGDCNSARGGMSTWCWAEKLCRDRGVDGPALVAAAEPIDLAQGKRWVAERAEARRAEKELAA